MLPRHKNMKALTLLLLSQLKQENNELIHKVYHSYNYILIVSTVSKRDITLNTIVDHLFKKYTDRFWDRLENGYMESIKDARWLVLSVV